MTADALLSRLDRVRRTGPGRWTASCPTSAHERGDLHPSLGIRELEDGRLLLRCHAHLCQVEDIVGAVGLELSDLFPEKPIEHARRERRPFNAHDVLACIAFEATIIVIASGDLRQGKALSDADHERVVLAAGRLQEAEGIANGRY